MHRLIINTGLLHSLTLESITAVTPKSIAGTCIFKNTPGFLAIEACAQLGALHVRYLEDFKQHAFLMQIKSFPMPAQLCGSYHLIGRMTSRSSTALAYTITMENKIITTGKLLFALKPYDTEFDQTRLTIYYKELFTCLTKMKS